MDYMLKRVDAFTRFLEDGRIRMTNNAAERALRGIALGRRSWLFVGSDRGGERAAVMFALIQTCLCRARYRQVCRTANYAERTRFRQPLSRSSCRVIGIDLDLSIAVDAKQRRNEGD
jgi:hypothetical protein